MIIKLSLCSCEKGADPQTVQVLYCPIKILSIKKSEWLLVGQEKGKLFAVGEYIFLFFSCKTLTFLIWTVRS